MAVLNVFEIAMEISAKSAGSSESKMGPQWVRFELPVSTEGM